MYIPCEENEVPGNVRFDCPRSMQGQMVEVEYGGHSRYEHGAGDPWKRITDRSARTVRYFKLAKPAAH